MDSFLQVKNKIDSFINKYYKSLLIKGIIYTVSLVLLYLIVFSTIEYFGWLSTQVRFIIFWFTVISLLFVFNYFIVIPLLRLFGIASKITDKHAALIIQNNVSDINDELVNTLELYDSSLITDSELIKASLNQKSEILRTKDFSSAVTLYSKKYYYILAFLLIIVTSFFITPAIYNQGAKRIINYNTTFNKYENVKIIFFDSLQCKRNSDYLLKIKIVGNVSIENLFLKIGNSDFLMKTVSDSIFQYEIKNINNNFYFYFYSDDFVSNEFYFNIIDAPTIKYLTTELIYPEYINRKNDKLRDIFEFSVPQGTNIQWNIKCMYTDSLFIYFDTNRVLLNKNDNIFSFDTVLTKSVYYSISAGNKYFHFNIIDNKFIEVIPDVYPTIIIDKVVDESNFSIHHFKISVTDDYGFHNLVFYGSHDTIAIPLNKNIRSQQLYFSYDFSQLSDSVYNYYFAVRDNDIINGYKQTKSEYSTFEKPGLNKLVKQDIEATKNISDAIDKAISKSNELQLAIEKLKHDLLNKELAEWERAERIEQLKNKQDEIDELLNELNSLNNQKNTFNKSFSEMDESIVQKQMQLQEAMQNLMTDDIKKLFEELNELKNNLSNAELNEMMNKIDLNYENLETELDKNLELLNRLKIEQNIENIANKLDELSKQQHELSEQLDNNELNNDQLQDNLKSNKNDFDNLNDNFNKLFDENKELSNPFKLNDFSSDFNNINDNYNKQLNDSESGQNSNKSKSDNAKQNSEKLKELADKMRSQMSNSTAQQEAENADNLRQLLENLFYISFEQEHILDESKAVSSRDPKYIDIQNNQIKIHNDFSIVRDSLNELGKRTSYLGNHISELTFKIESGFTDCNLHFVERRNSSLYQSQQEVLMNVNELLLLLTESLKNMDNASSGSGGMEQQSRRKQKPKKGDGEPSMSDVKKGQESLKGQLEQMIQQMKDGSKPGKEGQMKLAQMLAQQEIYQQMLNQIMNNGSVGSNAQKQLKEIQHLMEQNKRDIVNMNISNSTLYRQQLITTRLLEAENAEMERNKEEKRESKEALNYNLSESNKYFDEYDEKIKFKEIFKQEYLELKDYYRELYNSYIINVNSNNDE